MMVAINFRGRCDKGERLVNGVGVKANGAVVTHIGRRGRYEVVFDVSFDADEQLATVYAPTTSGETLVASVLIPKDKTRNVQYKTRKVQSA